MKNRNIGITLMIVVIVILASNLISSGIDSFEDLTENQEPLENVMNNSRLKIQFPTSFATNFANLTGHGGAIWKIAFSPDDTILASSSRDGSVRLWNISTGETTHLLQGHGFHSFGIDFSSDGLILASAGLDDAKVNLWEISTGMLLQTWHNTYTGGHIDFSPVENSLLTYAQNQSIIIRNVTDGVVTQTLNGHTEQVWTVKFSPNGSLLASGSAGSIRIWNVSTGNEIRNFSGHSGGTSSIAFSPDNSLLASGGADYAIKIWDLASGTLLQTLPGQEHEVTAVAFSPTDSSILASGEGQELNPSTTHESSIKLWNISSGVELETLTGHTHYVNDIEFSHDGTILASCSIDRSVKLWGDYPLYEVKHPAVDWPTSTPEDQGLNSTLFDDEHLSKRDLHSLLIFRRGTLVYEEYYSDLRYRFTHESKHSVFSVTKSFTSTLIGIAIEKGFIQSVDEKVMDFFPSMTFANVNSQKEAMTVEHLLTMTTGLEWDDNVDNFRALRSPDKVQYILDKPMINDPGIVYNYNTGGSHLLSAIIQQTTGLNTFDFAMKYLFEPLGIEDSEVIWLTDPQGRANGGTGLFLTPRNMAKLGHLYLNNGSWNGQQIIPADWVAASTHNHIDGLSITSREIVEGIDGYGYQWWIYPEGVKEGYCAVGWNGQLIYVVPKYDIVIVATSGSWRTPYTLAVYVVNALISDLQTTITTKAASSPGLTPIMVFSSLIVSVVLFRKKERLR
ncbi:MAG: serine hydrolase [Candidatus Hermodarchaeota archaeon]